MSPSSTGSVSSFHFTSTKDEKQHQPRQTNGASSPLFSHLSSPLLVSLLSSFPSPPSLPRLVDTQRWRKERRSVDKAGRGHRKADSCRAKEAADAAHSAIVNWRLMRSATGRKKKTSPHVKQLKVKM